MPLAFVLQNPFHFVARQRPIITEGEMMPVDEFSEAVKLAIGPMFREFDFFVRHD